MDIFGAIGQAISDNSGAIINKILSPGPNVSTASVPTMATVTSTTAPTSTVDINKLLSNPVVLVGVGLFAFMLMKKK